MEDNQVLEELVSALKGIQAELQQINKTLAQAPAARPAGAPRDAAPTSRPYGTGGASRPPARGKIAGGYSRPGSTRPERSFNDDGDDEDLRYARPKAPSRGGPGRSNSPGRNAPGSRSNSAPGGKSKFPPGKGKSDGRPKKSR